LVLVIYKSQIKVFENLEALENNVIFSMGGKVKNLPNRRFSAPNKEIPNIYLEVREARRRPTPRTFWRRAVGARGSSPEPARL
jgi:hypothetical protein